MDQFTTEQNFQLSEAIDMIDYMADEVFNGQDSEDIVNVEVFNAW